MQIVGSFLRMCDTENPSSSNWLNCRFPLLPEKQELGGRDEATARLAHLCQAKVREDGREFCRLRPIFSRIHISSKASGSCYLSQGNTKVLCAIFGPKPLASHFRSASSLCTSVDKGTLDIEVTFTSFSKIGRGCASSHMRSTTAKTFRSSAADLAGTPEEERLANRLAQVFQSVVLLERFPNSVLNVRVTIFENEGGVTSASINCVSMALADAGVPMKDLCVATTVGIVVCVPASSVSPPTVDTPNFKRQQDDKALDSPCQSANTVLCSEQASSVMFVDPLDSELLYDFGGPSCYKTAGGCFYLSILHLGLCTKDNTVALLDTEGIFDTETTATALRLAEAACSQTSEKLSDQLRRQLAHHRRKEHVEAVLTEQLLSTVVSVKP